MKTVPLYKTKEDLLRFHHLTSGQEVRKKLYKKLYGFYRSIFQTETKMSPKPDKIISDSPEKRLSSKCVELRVTSSVKESKANQTIRHPDFARMQKPFGLQLHVAMAILLIHAHIFTAYSFYLTFMGKVPLSTFLFDLLLMVISGLGITVGCHRYWSHRTFKANKALQIMLMIMQTMALQYPIHKWSLDHRLHHKYTDTDKDPHNSKRGFFYSHIGWLLSKRHPEFQKAWDTFEVPDLENDPIVRFQSRWYWTLVTIFHTIIPVTIIYMIWEMPLLYCVAINYRRYILSKHATWSVNSFAHMFGDRPYDKNISSVENPTVSLFALGEGWHNYHHTFPWDYKASEFGWRINFSTMFIDFFAWIGWASDLKTVSQEMLKQRLRRTGDGSHAEAITEENNENDFDFHIPPDATALMKGIDRPIWGWDDEKMTEEFRSITKILRPSKSEKLIASH